jgi:hypothetical protein
MKNLSRLLFAQGAIFAIACAIHAGVLFAGYEHHRAMVAEAVLAAVLIVAAISSVANTPWRARIGLAAQAFALLGTLVGLWMVLIGVGPGTPLDLVLHAATVLLLVVGLTWTLRASRAARMG